MRLLCFVYVFRFEDFMLLAVFFYKPHKHLIHSEPAIADRSIINPLCSAIYIFLNRPSHSVFIKEERE